MSSKNFLQTKDDGCDVQYAHILQVLCDWVATTVFVLIGGRGLAKSTVIMARRSYQCVYDMPGGAFAFVCNTYQNLTDNIMPAVQKGWGLMGWQEDRDYIKGRRPPESWRRRCSVIVDDYTHVYSFPNGSVIFLGSLDNPSLLAGKSVLHLFFDEAKYDKEQKVNRALPILRGDAITYGRSVLFLGMTITTDMPDITEGEFDWFFRFAAEMDVNRIVDIVKVASARNELLIKIERQRRREKPSQTVLTRLNNQLKRYDQGLRNMRHGQTFFFNASSFVNIQILTAEYIRRLYNGALELHEFQKSVLGMRPGLKRELRFYILWGEQHKYYDGTEDGQPAQFCRQLIHLHRDHGLEAGLDFGNMNSLVVSQPDGRYHRVHKTFYVLPPNTLRQLADQFLAFFGTHMVKELDLYYDRAGNNYAKQHKDLATEIKNAIEKDADGHRTGWKVTLKSRNQGIIRQHAEYNFMQELMGGENPALPVLLVDAINCKELVSSIELAKAEVSYRGDVKVVAKIKKSEKLEARKLPMLSTNFSDAFKYLFMRRSWMDMIQRLRRGTSSSSAAMVDQWLEERGS